MTVLGAQALNWAVMSARMRPLILAGLLALVLGGPLWFGAQYRLPASPEPQPLPAELAATYSRVFDQIGGFHPIYGFWISFQI